jgi:hypothetical protein
MIEVSTGEIQRVGVWSLRALGLKYGSADRAAPLLVATECAVGGAIETLGRNEHAMKSSASAPIGRIANDVDFWTLDLASRSLLQSGPVALDLVTYAARSFGSGRVDLTGCFDPIFAPALCQLAARRGIGMLFTAQAPFPAGKLGRLRWFVALPTSTPTYLGGDDETIPAAVLDACGTKAAAKVAAAGEWLAALEPGKQGCSIVGFQTDEHPALPGRYVMDVEAAIKDGQAKGVPVDKDVLSNLYRIERETWAPTSDRSRSQALF